MPAAFVCQWIGERELRLAAIGDENLVVRVAEIEFAVEQRRQHGAPVRVVQLGDGGHRRELVGKLSAARPATAVAKASSAPCIGACARRSWRSKHQQQSARSSNEEKGPGLLPGPQWTFQPAFSEVSLFLCTGLLVVLARALLGLGVVVAALQRDPVSLDVLAARQEVRPRVARHQTVGLPDRVELTVGAHFADVAPAWSGGGWAASWRCRRSEFGASRPIIASRHLVHVRRTSTFSTAFTHSLEADHVRFHRIVEGALRVLGVGVPLVDALGVAPGS